MKIKLIILFALALFTNANSSYQITSLESQSYLINKLLSCQHDKVSKMVKVIKSNNLRIEHFLFKDNRPFIIDGFWFQTTDSIYVNVRLRESIIIPYNQRDSSQIETNLLQNLKIKRISIVWHKRIYWKKGFINFSKPYE